MKTGVIVLAAGRGTRLYPLTETLPKCLVPVAGCPLLGHLLQGLASVRGKNGLDLQVHLVTGFEACKIEDYLQEQESPVPVRTVANADYATTNNLYSLRLALDDVREAGYDRLLWVNGDCIYDRTVFEKAVAPGPSGILCDSLAAYNDESMKIDMTDGRIRGISKTIPAGENTLVSIDFYTLDKPTWAAFDCFIDAYCVGPKRNVWAEAALNDFLQENAAGERYFAPRDIKGARWVEIDNAKDLALAEKLWADPVARATG